jgi:hypothetical protein
VVATYGVDGLLDSYLETPLCSAGADHGAAYSPGTPIVVGDGGAIAAADGIPPAPTTFGAGEPNETTLTPDPEGIADGTGAAAIAVYEADGTLRWAVMVENGAHDVQIGVNEIAIGPSGELIAAGYYGAGNLGAEALIYGTDGEYLSLGFVEDPEIDETASFLAKWSPDGIIEWVKQIPPVQSVPLFVRDDGTIMLMNGFLDGVAFDPGGPGETVIDHGPCTTQFCFFAVEIAPDGSSFTPILMDGGGSYIGMRPDGSFALADSNLVRAYGADYALEWEAEIKIAGTTGGAWIHDVAALADGSVVVIGDYTDSIVLGQGEPNETVLHGVCDDCKYGAFLARYAW